MKPFIILVEVNGEEFRLAAMTIREFEHFIEAVSDDPAKMKALNVETLANSMRKAGMEIDAERVLEDMPIPVFNALRTSFLAMQGIKLEAKQKTGGPQPS